jgi:hypothetical protein
VIARLVLLATCAIACTGPTYDTKTPPKPFNADAPAIYVAKVKTILVGLPPTDAEINAVVADPNALAGLVDQWMALPQYEPKMMVFFELTFQQTQVGTADFTAIAPPNGFVGAALPLMIQNATESFARTMLAFNESSAPLTNAFTTHQFMLTPALAQFYGYLDIRRSDDAGKLLDQFSKDNPTLQFTIEASKGPIALSDSFDPTSANYMHFYNPDLPTLHYQDSTCNGVDPVTVAIVPLQGATQLMDILYGQVPLHAIGSVKCPSNQGGNGAQIAASDFTAWKMMTIRPPHPGEAKTRFFDLPALRSATELVLDIPRVGFFTTPAFLANWPTNSGNQMRGPLNQTLIVATGHQIDGSDGTIPPSTPGLDPAHTAPGSTCYGCHQLLDPTRSILSANYSWFWSPQTDAQLSQQPGMFAFQHVVAPMSTIDDFAKLLASHPLVAEAWVQKLCYYVNSSPCEPTDPEFQRIVTSFATNNFTWNALVHDFMISPIVTNAARTKTHDTNGEVLSVTRRDHLCAAINNRLGFVDICLLSLADQGQGLQVGPIAAIVGGMPADAYGRGGVAPILPNQPSLFYRGALENVCEYLAQATIDAPLNPKQPGAKAWKSTDSTGAIDDFVSTVIAITPSDARAQPVTDALTRHFQSAMQDGASATDALRSTFVVACLSPSFAGVGL